MILTKDNLLTIVENSILQNDSFKEALDTIRINSSGKIWLIGGALYKNLVKELYGTCKKPAKDFDLIVEKANERLVIPKGWKRTTNRFGNPKLFNDKIEIDFIPLESIYYIRKNKLKPTIENFLAGVPLNIHFLVYNILDGKIFGDVGIKALEEKVVRVYNLQMLRHIAKKYYKTANEIIREKAKALGFKAELV